MLLLFGWWVNLAERQRLAVQKIQAAGVDVRYRYYGPFCGCCGCWEGEPKSPGLWVLSKFLPKDFYDPIYEVNLRDVEVTPEVLRAIATFPNVKRLIIEKSKFHESDLECLQTMTKLRELQIVYMPIGEIGLKHIGRMSNLRYLSLYRTRATPRNLSLISHLNLCHVHFDFTFVTDESLALLSSFKSLESIDLSHSQVTNAGLLHLSKLENISELRLNNTAIDDEGLVHIARLPLLSSLELNNTSTSDHGLEYFVSSPSKFLVIDAQQTCVTDKGCNRLNEQMQSRGGIIHDWLDLPADHKLNSPPQPAATATMSENSLVKTSAIEP